MDNLYIRRLTLPGVNIEQHFFKFYSSKGLHSSPYPYGIFADKGLEEIRFSPITIFCGDNGSGKSTLLNILAQCLGITHSSAYNAAYYLHEYVAKNYYFPNETTLRSAVNIIATFGEYPAQLL